MKIFNFRFFRDNFWILKILRKNRKSKFSKSFFSQKKSFFAPIFFLMINLYKYFTRVDFYGSCRKIAQNAGGNVSDTPFCIANLQNFRFFWHFFDILNTEHRFFGKSKFSNSFFSKKKKVFQKNFFFGQRFIWKLYPCHFSLDESHPLHLVQDLSVWTIDICQVEPFFRSWLQYLRFKKIWSIFFIMFFLILKILKFLFLRICSILFDFHL